MKGDEGTSSANEYVKKTFNRICVFCGSRAGYKSSFSDAALQLGKELVNRKIDLVYGGGSIGLMGLVSKTVYEGGCHVLGIIPRALLPHEISGKTYGELKIVADMHQRKSEMEKHADAFIALPGGYGTMEELLEMITWAQLGIHEKPVRSFSLCYRILELILSSLFSKSRKRACNFASSIPSPNDQRKKDGLDRWGC